MSRTFYFNNLNLKTGYNYSSLVTHSFNTGVIDPVAYSDMCNIVTKLNQYVAHKKTAWLYKNGLWYS